MIILGQTPQTFMIPICSTTVLYDVGRLLEKEINKYLLNEKLQVYKIYIESSVNYTMTYTNSFIILIMQFISKVKAKCESFLSGNHLVKILHLALSKLELIKV